ncbi:MAG TPA: phosphatase domain-containing protein [Longimicrobiales bacterium]|nr:phosphatase domain-containing protein [Longimicrobiales bacterium]
MSPGSGWERWASRLVRSVERTVDDARGRIRDLRARQVVPYRGFGNRHETFVTGRVLADAPHGPVSATDPWWQNVANTYRHLGSGEVGGARVRLTLGGASQEAVTDEEGFYRAWLKSPTSQEEQLWHDVEVDVVDRVHPEVPGVHASGRIMIPGSSAEFGVISDLDDTVLRTDATRLLSMLKRTLLENALTRLPFDGVAAFYRALHEGNRGGNPVFYVSSSPWNLYSVLTDFLAHHAIPEGPLMLRDWGISEHGVLPTGHGVHKHGAIDLILKAYPDLPFILIGDSGQEDPEIYRDVVHRHGSRINAVYIRNVTPDPLRIQAIRRLADEVREAGSELLLSEDTLASARHAAERGWIRADGVDGVRKTISSGAGRPE